MQSWERRQKHRDDSLIADKAAGNRRTQEGGTLYFNGPAYFAKIAEMGHSASHFDDCSCKKD